jgi:glutamate synthase (NADPH/NADH)
VHHFCALLGYGADAICPSLALDALAALASARGADLAKATSNFFYGVNAGVLKTMAKMGVSTLSSYKGAQIFEAVGLGPAVVDAAFAGTPSRVGGLDFGALGADALALHAAGWAPPAAPAGSADATALPNPGDYAYRNGPAGATEVHLNHPAAIADLQSAARTGSEAAYRAFADRTDALNRGVSLRGLIAVKAAADRQVDELKQIVKLAREQLGKLRGTAQVLAAICVAKAEISAKT